VLVDPGYKFCPKCGAALTKRRLKEFEPERLVCPNCGFVLYLNPKVAAGTVVEYNGGIVLLRREIDPRAGYWVYPGGFVDRGETVESAACRETREEVGLDVEVTGHLGTYSFTDSEVVVVTYAARVIGGAPIVGDESLEVATFSPHEIPWEDLAFPSTRLALIDYLRLHHPAVEIPAVGAATTATTPAPVPRPDGGAVRGPTATTEPDDSFAALTRACAGAREARDVRAASTAYPLLIEALRRRSRYREALAIAEEGLALTHDPLLARLADEIAHEKAAAEADRC
jgi:8-oxo-dGTP diphosphatase